MSDSQQPTPNSQPTPEQELDQIDVDMHVAEQKALQAQADYETWQAAENAALIAIYDVWKDKEHRIDLLEPYCARHQIPWHGSYKNNRFLPIVKKMFPKRTPENHSEYSGAMAYAWEEQTPSQNLPDFIKSKGGVQKTYRAYSSLKKSRKLATKNGLQPTSDQIDILINVFNSVRIMLRLTFRGKTNIKGELKEARQFLVRNSLNDVGNHVGIIETVTTAYTAPASRMVLDRPIEELQGRAYLLDDAAAQLFVDLYPQEKGWSITADQGGLALRAANGVEVRGNALDPNDPRRLRVLDKLDKRTPYMLASLEKIKGFEDWYQNIKSAADRQWRKKNPYPLSNVTPMTASILYAVHANAFPRQPIPSALDFNSWTDHVTVGFNRSTMIDGSAMRYHVHDLFETPEHVAVSHERRLLVKHARKLFSVLVDEGEDALFYLADTDEKQGAFVCEVPMDEGAFTIAYPTIMSADDDPRCILDDLDKSRIADSRINIPTTPRASSAHIGPSLRDLTAEQVAKQFGAFITSHRSPDETKWLKRRAIFAKQLKIWLDNADVPLHLRLSGWSKQDIATFNAEFNGLLDHVEEFDGSYREHPGSLLVHNRIECLKDFYASEYDWGIMLDDDAVLYDQPKNNSGWNLFPEMSRKKPSDYAEIDAFFPNNPAKLGGSFSAKYAEDPKLYSENHVFERNLDLKGSMFVVRNFRKHVRPLVLPDPSYIIHGEDTLFATEAVKQGCTVMKC